VPALKALPAVLRAGVLAALAGALLAPEPRPATAGGAGVVRLQADRPDLPDSLLAGTPPALLVRQSDRALDAAELDALAAAAARAPLLVRLPEAATWVEADPPQRPIVGRAAAIPFRVRAPDTDSVLVRLSDAAGVLDSVRVAPGPDGAAAGAFRVRPPRAGWREWTVEAAGGGARTGAWVTPGAAPRVLVAAGAPSWESRFLVRALEESGAAVALSQPLGRGLAVRQGEGGVPADAAALARFDAVLVLEGAEPGAAQRAALADYASRLGGGVLFVGGGGAGPLRVADGSGAAGEVAGDRVRWTLPAELAALPAARVRSAAAPVGRPVPGAVAAASAPGGTLLALRPAGRGRAAALGLTETWRWRMEAGRVAEHREFWRSLVDWLASAPRDSVTVDMPEPVGAVGAAVEVRVYAPAAGAGPLPPLTLARPDGRREALPLAPDPRRPGTLRAGFVPDRPGVYSLTVGGAQPVAGFRAQARAAAPDAWARLALLAARSGGAALPQRAYAAELARREAALPRPGRQAPPWRWILLAAAALLAVAEWAARRLSGGR
jgi:hypothetical protein